MELNNQIFLYFYNLSHQSLFFDKLIVFTAHTFPFIVILLAGIFLLFHHDVLPSKNPFLVFKKKWQEIILVFFTGIFAWSMAQILKILFQNQRPLLNLDNIIPLLEKSSFSFPSGHATFFMALATAIFLEHKKMGYTFCFFALLIGLARIIAGVHFPVDILAGYSLGIIIAFLVSFFIKRKKKIL